MRWLLVLVFLLPLAAAQNVQEVHVTLSATAEDAEQEPMRVSGLFVHWGTDTAYGPDVQPEVLYRLEDGPEQRTAAQRIGSPEDLISTSDPLARATPDAVYGAAIAAPPDANLTYRVGAPAAGHTDERSVRMPAAEQVRVVAYGDIGHDGITDDDDPAPLRVRDLALAQEPDLVLIPGDIVYDDSNGAWDAWLAAMDPLFATVPVMPVVGNHEPDRQYHQFKQRFEVPRIPPAVNAADRVAEAQYDPAEEYYAFQAGPAYFVGLNSDGVCRDDAGGTVNLGSSTPPCEQGGHPDVDQYNWLHDILEDAREQLDPAWLIVYFHHPPYSWSAHGDDAAVKQLWVPFFETYHVDLVITAHEHVYQRSHPIIGGVPVQTGDELRTREGVTYVVTGGGGRSLYDIKSEPYPSWMAAGTKKHHVTVLDITNETLSAQAIEADNGTLIDAFTIHRPGSPSYPAPQGQAAPTNGSPVGLVAPAAALLLGALGNRRFGQVRKDRSRDGR